MRIDIEKIKEDDIKYIFEILLSDNDRIPPFTVTLDKDYYKKIAEDSVTPEKLVEESFRFLLEKEPQGSILKEFNLKVISTYFPEYEEGIKKVITN